MIIEKIKKRNGEIVSFDRTKIEQAMGKAFLATGVTVSPETLSDLTDRVITVLQEKFIEQIPGVEDVQDIVELKLAEAEYFDVAKKYIIYRRERSEAREKKKQKIIW